MDGMELGTGAVGGTVRKHSFSWLVIDVYDGVCMGPTERARADELSGSVSVHGAVPAVGALFVLDSTGKQRDYGFDWHHCGTCLLLSGRLKDSVHIAWFVVVVNGLISDAESADVFPTIARIRGWKTQQPLATPRLM